MYTLIIFKKLIVLFSSYNIFLFSFPSISHVMLKKRTESAFQCHLIYGPVHTQFLTRRRAKKWLFLGVAEAIVGSLLFCCVGIVQSVFNLL